MNNDASRKREKFIYAGYWVQFIILLILAANNVLLRNKYADLKEFVDKDLESGLNEYYAGYEDGYHVAIHQLSQN